MLLWHSSINCFALPCKGDKLIGSGKSKTAPAATAGAITETAKVMEKTKNYVKDAFNKMADDASKLINGMSKTFSGK